MRRFLLAAAFTLAGVAPVEAQDEEKPRVRRQPDRITAAEIAERPDLQSAYDAVNRLRPLWLRVRSTGTPNRAPPPIVVYVDGVRAGDIETLRQMPVAHVAELQHLSANDATTRYGTDHSSGAILVRTTRTGTPPPAG